MAEYDRLIDQAIAAELPKLMDQQLRQAYALDRVMLTGFIAQRRAQPRQWEPQHG